jgi:hypothetical protein
VTLERPLVDTDGAACPDTERLAEYADHTLPEPDRVAIERHLAGCPDCRSALVVAVSFREQDERAGVTSVVPPVRVVPFRRRWVIATGVAVAAAAALVLVVRPDLSPLFGRDAGRSPAMAQLVSALSASPTRAGVGRLTGGFAYAPPPSATRGTAGTTVDPAVRIAAAALEARASSGGTPEDARALGVAYLAAEEVDRAIAPLADAATRAPGNPAFASDLAAAYLTRGVRDGNAADLRLAVASADRALQLDPNLLEARFNRAMALAALPEPDLDGLKDYAQRDAGPWGDEARKRAGER